VLRDPAWADSAVVINEYGEVPLDHDLVSAGDETFLSVATGCLCCVVRSDLTRTLLDLHRRRTLGEVPPYARVLIETSGLAGPRPHPARPDAGGGDDDDAPPGSPSPPWWTPSTAPPPWTAIRRRGARRCWPTASC
jgi:hypothetical protein